MAKIIEQHKCSNSAILLTKYNYTPIKDGEPEEAWCINIKGNLHKVHYCPECGKYLDTI